MRGFFTGWCLILFCTSILFAQSTIKSLPIQFNQYMRAYPLINPASSGTWAKTEINTGIQRQTGNWNNISTYYANATIRLSKDDSVTIDQSQSYLSDTIDSDDTTIIAPPTRYHVAGLSLVGDKEGEFLNRTGVYGLYAWHTRLTNTLFVSAGAAIGIKNYAVGANYINGGGSAFAPDGSIGLWLYQPGSHLGISVNQLFNSKLTPIKETTQLIPFYSLTAGKTWEINRFFSVKPAFLIRTANQLPMDIDLNITGLIQQFVAASVNYKIRKGITFMVGIEKIRAGNHYFRTMFSYYVPRGVYYNYININTYEITLNYFIRPNQKTIVIQ